MSLRTDLSDLPSIRPGLTTTGPNDFYLGFSANSAQAPTYADLSSYEQLLARRVSDTYHNSFFKRDDMSALDSAKIRFLHQKILERFEESPTSSDEELLQLFDFNLPNVISTYQSLGRSEHPIFTRDRWLSEAAAKMTDDGYATWLNKSIGNQKVYHYSGDTIRVRAPVPASSEPTWPFEAQAPQMPATAIDGHAAAYEELIRATVPAPIPQSPAPFATRGFDRGTPILPTPHLADLWAATNATDEIGEDPQQAI